MYYNEHTTLYLNGEFIKASAATTTLYDQTMHYGYGVFEGIRAYKTENGTRIFKAFEHYERLRNSCELVGIPFEYHVDDLVAQTYNCLFKTILKMPTSGRWCIAVQT